MAALQSTPMARPPRIPVWLRHDQVVTYFITICVENRRIVLDNPAAFQAIKSFCRPNQNLAHGRCGCDAPIIFTHWCPPIRDRDARITQFSAGLKRFVRSETQAVWKWQEGVFYRLLRKDEFAESKWQYIRENPVRAGLVERWQD
jgi:putative transposase